jgi:apolipoprotein N-acyltransferase
VVISGAGAGSGTLTVSTTAASTGALAVPPRPGVRYVPAALAGLLLLLVPRRQRRLGVMVLLLAALGGGLLGCGGHASSNTAGSPGTTSGSYTITVTATSGNVSAQTTVNVTVQ